MSTNLSSRYNSPTLSNITIVLPRNRVEKKRKKSDGEHEDNVREKIFAHKAILASGSSAFERYFQTVSFISGTLDA